MNDDYVLIKIFNLKRRSGWWNFSRKLLFLFMSAAPSKWQIFFFRSSFVLNANGKVLHSEKILVSYWKSFSERTDETENKNIPGAMPLTCKGCNLISYRHYEIQQKVCDFVDP